MAAFTKGPLAYLLKNRMYLGQINHGPNSYPGKHPAIIARDIFDAVQARLASQAAASGYRRSPSDALLTKKLFDDLGRPMTPSHTVKGGVRYRYYISHGFAGQRGDAAAPVARLPAPEVEEAVLKALADSPGVKETPATLIALAPLDRADVARMVGELASRHALSKEVIDGVSERTGGVPSVRRRGHAPAVAARG